MEKGRKERKGKIVWHFGKKKGKRTGLQGAGVYGERNKKPLEGFKQGKNVI